VISYRALKKLIGESSLERKCRFLFGIALLLLITASFWLYASRTRRLIEYQQLLAARMLIPQLLKLKHYSKFAYPDGPGAPMAQPPANPDTYGPQSEPAKVSDRMSEFSRILETQLPSSDLTVWSLTSAAHDVPESDQGFEARRMFLDEENPQDEHWIIREEDDLPRKLIFFGAIRLTAGCRRCHDDDDTVTVRGPPGNPDSAALAVSAVDGQSSSTDVSTSAPVSAETRNQNSATPEAAADAAFQTAATVPAVESRAPLMSIARVEISLETVDAQLNRNRAILLATGIVTAFLAMLAAYAIVRYIIVKPVQHLKDVSDEIARGNLNLRADISTGDEFEELSHAFNRMLRHMMTGNDELRSLNLSLDGKIDQLAQANMELFNNNRLKDDFLATISHELRTPLNSILGFSDILNTASNLDERQRRYVKNILTSGQSLMVQINDLLDLAKIESGKMELQPDAIQLPEILDAQVQQIMPLADRKNIDLRIESAPAPLPMLQQDRSKISQILTNLLSNAIKFTPEGGRVRVSSKQVDDQTVEFSVEDTGIGIPLQEQEHIFEKFRQGSTAPGTRDHVKREYEGTGLGLSIVRELARLLGGDVSLRSEFGRGSLFTVRLPVTAPDKKRTEPEEVVLESRSSTSLPKITAVDLWEPRESTPEVPEHDPPLDVTSI
jgi:two-component system sensor histidine kinase BarA